MVVLRGVPGPDSNAECDSHQRVSQQLLGSQGEWQLSLSLSLSLSLCVCVCVLRRQPYSIYSPIYSTLTQSGEALACEGWGGVFEVPIMEYVATHSSESA